MTAGYGAVPGKVSASPLRHHQSLEEPHPEGCGMGVGPATEGSI